MDSITVRFTTRWPPNPTSPIIARLAGSKQFSHCMNIINGEAYEATMLHGCRVVPEAIAMKGVAAYQDMLVPVTDLYMAIQFGRAQIGAKYDFAGAFGIPFLMSKEWSDWRRWWCSEFCFIQLGWGGAWLLDPEEHNRVTPMHLLMCNFKKGPVIRLQPNQPA